MHAELDHDFGPVSLDGARGDAENGGDLFAGLPSASK
jgi:hypothetical protein